MIQQHASCPIVRAATRQAKNLPFIFALTLSPILLQQIDADPLKEREAELCNILEYANVHGLKQIKGIEDRLYGLDQLLNDVKKLERDQHDQAASLIQVRFSCVFFGFQYLC